MPLADDPLLATLAAVRASNPPTASQEPTGQLEVVQPVKHSATEAENMANEDSGEADGSVKEQDMEESQLLTHVKVYALAHK